MRLLFSNWMSDIDSQAIRKLKFPSLLLMENAAQKAAAVCREEFPRARFDRALIFAGRGNNGGDGIALARILANSGYSVELFLLFPAAQLTAEGRKNLRLAKSCGIRPRRLRSVSKVVQCLKLVEPGRSFLVDAIFGTGLRGEVREGFLLELIRAMNGSGLKILALDIPSGMGDGFIPESGKVIRADVTVTFHLPKWAFFAPDGNESGGRLYVADISLPGFLKARDEFDFRAIDPRNLKPLLAKRSASSHKGDFGHLLSVCGSVDKPGAGILAAEAALKSGAGLVTCAVRPQMEKLFMARMPELMLTRYENYGELEKEIGKYSCLLLGPGLHPGSDLLGLLKFILKNSSAAVVLDADALNVLAGDLAILSGSSARVVLTPHLKEFSRLCGMPMVEILQKRVTIVREFALRHGLHLLLKGHHTVLATPAGEVAVNFSGNPGMATAGSGDVLSGLLAGLIAQFQKKFEIAEILKLGVFLHGFSGDLAVLSLKKRSLVASDLIAALPLAFESHDSFRLPFLFC
jgi:NAD(P)H-hydrate epimerase